MATSAAFTCIVFVCCISLISSASLRLRRSTDDTQVPGAMLQLLQRYDGNIVPMGGGGLQNDGNPSLTSSEDRFFWEYLLSRATGNGEDQFQSRKRKRCKVSWKILC